jgi:hypothetical protein
VAALDFRRGPSGRCVKVAVKLSARKGTLTRIFAGVLFLVAAHMLYRKAGALGPF